MNASFNLLPEAVAVVRADTKREVLERVAAQFAGAYGLDDAEVLEGLLEREMLGSTGFGRGVAMPHARSEAVRRPSVVVLRLDHAVDYGAADAIPVELVFGIVSPVQGGVAHLHALAALARLVRDDALHGALLDATSAEGLFALMTNSDDRDAA